MSIPVIIGDRVLIVDGLCIGRRGVVRRTMRQRGGKKEAIFWVEVERGEQHAFLRDEFVFDGHDHVAGEAPSPAVGNASKGDESK